MDSLSWLKLTALLVLARKGEKFIQKLNNGGEKYPQGVVHSSDCQTRGLGACFVLLAPGRHSPRTLLVVAADTVVKWIKA